MANADPKQVVKALIEYYSTSELKGMCFDIDIDWEDLGGQGKSGKARELVQFADRRGRLGEIVAYVQKTRPQVNLEGGSTTPASTQTQAAEKPSEPSVTHNYYGPVNQGNSTTVGNISDSSGIAIGEDTSATVESTDSSVTNTNSGTMVGSTMGGGEVTAENIAGGNIDITNAPKNQEEFNQQVEALKRLLEQAIANEEFDDPRDASDAKEEIQSIIEEIESDNPRARKIKSGLRDVGDILGSAVKVAETAGKATAAVITAAPLVHNLINVISKLF